ncbi:MAG TPA: histidine kinase [Chloroflexota bacterium]|nr:histidine kinase [Chloroflexota bacterium]
MDSRPDLIPLLLGQLVFTAVATAVVLYLVLTRGRTVREGREQAICESLALANRTLPYLRQGLNRMTAKKAAAVIHEFLQPAAVAIVSGRKILAHVGAGADHHEEGQEPLTTLSRELLRTGRPLVARSRAAIGCSQAGCPLETAVAAPLTLRRQVAGGLVVYFGLSQPLTAGKVKMVRAMAQLMSLQMELAELDRQTERLAKAELAALQAQISPHFVYNTLNTIAAFIRTEPETARQLLTDFADFLRRTFRRKGEYSPFAQELEYVHQYLTFEKARFGDRLEVVYRVDPEILSTVVPVLVLQPLVENAVRHGISRKLGPGRVVIAAEDRGNECWISVEDDGVGMDAELVQQVLQRPRRNTYGVGLSNVNERLRSIYGPEYGLEIVSRPGEGTRVSFSVPKYKAGVEI